MLYKKLNEITLEDLNELVTNEVGESKTLEYKSELNMDTDSDRKEFLADISSFANSDGGDIIWGIKEDSSTNLPIELSGIEIENEDRFLRKIESVVRDSISPRIPDINFRVLHISGNKYIFITRIERSYLSPHRVVFKGWDKFFARNSKGKYSMEVEELRTAFTLQQTIEAKINNYINETLMSISQNRHKELNENSPIFVLQYIPLSAFNLLNKYSMNEISRCANKDNSTFYGLYSAPQRITIDGVELFYKNADYNVSEKICHKTNGIVEMSTTSLFCPNYTQQNKAPAETYNAVSSHDMLEYCINKTSRIKIYYSELSVRTPIIISSAILNGAGFSLPKGRGLQAGFYNSILDRDFLSLPTVFIEDFNKATTDLLKPLFDSIWNAFGRFYCTAYNQKSNEYIGLNQYEASL